MSEVHAGFSTARISELKRAADELGVLATSHEASNVDQSLAAKLQEHLLAMRSIEVKARKQAASGAPVPSKNHQNVVKFLKKRLAAKAKAKPKAKKSGVKSTSKAAKKPAKKR